MATDKDLANIIGRLPLREGESTRYSTSSLNTTRIDPFLTVVAKNHYPRIVSHNSIAFHCRNIWSVRRGFAVRPLGENLVHIKYNDHIDRARVWHGEPWLLGRKYPLVLKPSDDLNVDFESCPWWIHLYNCPLNLMNEEFTAFARNKIGKSCLTTTPGSSSNPPKYGSWLKAKGYWNPFVSKRPVNEPDLFHVPDESDEEVAPWRKRQAHRISFICNRTSHQAVSDEPAPIIVSPTKPSNPPSSFPFFEPENVCPANPSPIQNQKGKKKVLSSAEPDVNIIPVSPVSNNNLPNPNPTQLCFPSPPEPYHPLSSPPVLDPVSILPTHNGNQNPQEYLYGWRGVGSPRKFQELDEIVRAKSPHLIFLCETKSNQRQFDHLKEKLGMFGLCVEAQGSSGDLAMLWRKDLIVNLRSFSDRFIDTNVVLLGSSVRITGIYGEPDVSLCRDAWNYLSSLYDPLEQPWLMFVRATLAYVWRL
ncbi:OLC1v1025159C1 [Oldenlandia corymbosa var. corymbosa]|uniref:OLC1v1025159C1 n=1 Tax=Oldenlandia corymbosa var. corymbosa TaxID=529605 RepID=A0AAV1C4Z0_OLDCO|nr:OLC1v1025159C1 [Oldenlandia corymbosa var. corymbosa]